MGRDEWKKKDCWYGRRQLLLSTNPDSTIFLSLSVVARLRRLYKGLAGWQSAWRLLSRGFSFHGCPVKLWILVCCLHMESSLFIFWYKIRTVAKKTERVRVKKTDIHTQELSIIFWAIHFASFLFHPFLSLADNPRLWKIIFARSLVYEKLLAQWGMTGRTSEKKLKEEKL